MRGLPSDPGSSSPSRRELSANGAAQLRDAAQRAMSMTHSSGAAIALLDVDELVTCASCGESVPPVGARSPLSGFTGLAIRKGQTLICDDTQTDTRVDAGVCREIKVFSMAVAPIKVGTTLEGVFAIFFNSPRAATRMRVAMLRTLADVAGAVLDRETVGAGKSASAATSSPPTPAGAMSAPPQPVLVPNSPGLTSAPAGSAIAGLKEITDDDVVQAMAQFPGAPAGNSSRARPENAVQSVQPQTSARSQSYSPARPAQLESVAQPQERPAVVKPPVPPAARVETKPASPSKTKLVAPVTMERPVERKPEEPQLLPAAADPTAGSHSQSKVPVTPAKQAPVAQAPLFQTIAPELRRRRLSLRVLLPVAGIAAAVIAVTGFMLYRSPGVNAKAKATVAAQTAPAAEQPNLSAPEQSGAAVEVDAPEAPAPSAQPPETLRRAETPPSKKQVAEAVPPKPAMVIRSSNEESRQRPEEQPVEPPPAIAASATGTVVLPVAKTETPAAPAAPRASIFVPAVLTQMTKPTYPPAAAIRRVQGTVVLQIKIGKDGKVLQATPVKGDPMLGHAAAGTVRGWRYKPATRDGVPVDSDGEVSINFKLPGQ